MHPAIKFVFFVLDFANCGIDFHSEVFRIHKQIYIVHIYIRGATLEGLTWFSEQRFFQSSRCSRGRILVLRVQYHQVWVPIYRTKKSLS